MLRSSRSEFGASDLVPPDIEFGMRLRLRQMRFGQPKEYAQMEQNEVQKFLSSKSVHNWLSEWNLSHTFSVSNREQTLDRKSRKVDFCVQCTGEEIDSALTVGLRRAALPSMPEVDSASAACALPASSAPLAFFGDGSVPCHNSFAPARNFPPSFLSRPCFFHAPSLMNASTNTQTTETTRTSGGTGGRMHVYRRASLLEEYAQKTLQRMEEREEKRGRKGKERRGKRDRERRGGGCRWWAGKCCGGRERDSSGDEEGRSFSSDGTIARKSSVASNEWKKGQPTKIVKRFTLSSRTKWGGEDETMPSNGTKWRRKAKGWGRGDYDNVPEGWGRTDESWEEGNG